MEKEKIMRIEESYAALDIPVISNNEITEVKITFWLSIILLISIFCARKYESHAEESKKNLESV